MKNKLFKPNPSKLKFKIIIEVYENCSSIGLVEENSYKPSYDEMVGILEIQKQGIIWTQREENMKMWKKENKTVEAK